MRRCLIVASILQLLFAAGVARASLQSYDQTIVSDAAGGLKPVARLSTALVLTGSNRGAFDFGFTDGGATFEFIVSGDPNANNGSYLAVGENSVSNLRYEAWSNTGEVGFTQLGVADYRFLPAVFSPPNPTHVTYVWNPATLTMRLYINGALAGSCPGVDPGFAMPRGQGWLGGNPNETELMVGTIHRVTVYEGMVSAEVIQSHADAFNDVVRPPGILTFAANPSAIFSPAAATLTWSVRDATAVFLNGQNVTGTATLTVNPSSTREYELVASNAVGTAVSNVTVRVNPGPEVQLFKANRNYVHAGEPVELGWNVKFAQSIGITPGPGDVTGRTVNGAGTVSVTPGATTTYTLRAQSSFGTNSSTLTVQVVKPANHLIISEFMADDRSVLADEDGDHSGWIEIHNPTASSVNLSGYFLSDNAADLLRWAFPSTNLPPGGYLVVFASGKGRGTPGKPLHTSFRLSDGGEYLGLTGPGLIPVHGFTPSYPPQRTDISYGLFAADPALVRYMGLPTPGAPNSETAPPPAPVTFSQQGGLFSSGFSVSLATIEPEAQIFYTTDGSHPASSTGKLYSGPIPISSTTRLRAVAKAGGATGRATGEYYVKMSAQLAGYTSSLPLMVIENFGAGTIPRKGWNATGAGLIQPPRQSAAWGLFERSAGGSAFTNAPQTFSLIGIRGRGAYSTEWRQKPYSVEVMDEEGEESDVSPLGLPAHADWVLYFPDPDQNKDPAMMFNTFAYELSARMGKYAARFRWVEAFINEDGGELTLADRRGVYVLLEKVARGEDRLDFKRLSADGSSGSWLLNINRMDPQPDTGWPAANGTTMPQFFRTAGPDRVAQAQPNTVYNPVPGDDLPQQWNGFFNFENPNGFNITAQQRASIEAWFTTFENVLYDNALWRDPTNGYRRYLDDRDFAQYFLLNVLSRNGDGLLISMYPWRGDDGRLRMGPGWDYNWSSWYVSGGPTGSLMHRSEQLWYARLFQDPDFHQLYVDCWWDFRRGAGSNAAMTALVDQQAAGIGADKAILNGMPSAAEWNSRLTQFKGWLTQRADWIDSNYLRPPAFNQPGGNVAAGFQVTLSGTNGVIYVTFDGQDPRAAGGGFSASARAYSGPFLIYAPVTIQARVKNGSTWSGLTTATFTTPQDLSKLAITEIMYNPVPGGAWTSDDLEFLELKNTGTTSLNLGTLRFDAGIDFTFTNGTTLGPGQFFVLARNGAAYSAAHLGRVAHGIFAGRLSNSGETLRLTTAAGVTVLAVTYSNREPWPLPAAGYGFSAVPRDGVNPGNSDNGERWRASTLAGGSPEADDPERPLQAVFINEVLSRAVAPGVDAIEIYNPGPGVASIGGWFLSDDGAAPKKFQIAPGTTLQPGSYRVYTASDFNPQPATPNNFVLDSAGDTLYLCSADAAGNLTGYDHGVKVGAAAAGVSFGRVMNSAGEEHFPAQVAVTLGEANAGPAVGPVVMSEIMYQPKTGGPEYVEVRNITNAEVPLYDLNAPSNTWSLSGFGFSFPAGTVLPANGVIVVTATNAAAFRTWYGVAGDVTVLGPTTGTLQDNGELVELVRPDSSDPAGILEIAVDAVRYNEKTPWPVGAQGSGLALHRVQLGAYGNEPANWAAAEPSPGEACGGPDMPVIVQQPLSQAVVAGSAVTLSVEVTNSAALPIQYRWLRNGQEFAGGSVLLNERQCFLTVLNVQPPSMEFSVQVVNDACRTGSSSATASITFLADDDSDGLPSVWETGNSLNPWVAEDRDQDPDRDGQLNWQEYNAGTDPNNALSYLALEAVVVSGSGAYLQFHAVAGKTYTVEYRDSLESGGWLRLADVVASGVNGQQVVVDSTIKVKRFYRLVTPRQP